MCASRSEPILVRDYKCPYEALGLPAGTAVPEVRAAYRRAALAAYRSEDWIELHTVTAAYDEVHGTQV